MTIETLYELGQHVWPIVAVNEPIYAPCSKCNGAGWFDVVGLDARHKCPQCLRVPGKTTLGHKMLMYVGTPMIVGQVRCEITHHSYVSESLGNKEKKVEYMCDSTGVCSGRLWQEPELFPSKDAAEAHCLKVNEAPPEHYYETHKKKRRRSA